MDTTPADGADASPCRSARLEVPAKGLAPRADGGKPQRLGPRVEQDRGRGPAGAIVPPGPAREVRIDAAQLEDRPGEVEPGAPAVVRRVIRARRHAALQQ